MKQSRIILIPVILGYLTIVVGYVLFQRHLIYHPVPLNGTTPENFGLKDFHDVSFGSPDGITLTGWWIEHPEKDPHRPFLLYCHGNGDCVSQLAEVAKLFYDYGFDALIFDYRDYGGSDKGPLSETALDGDAMGAYKFAKAKGIPDDRIIVWGHSLGSSVAAELATQIHPAGLILEGAFPSVYKVSRQRDPWLIIFPFMIWDKFETERYVKERSCPLLQIHAEKDTIIPISLGKDVFDKAAEPKQWITVTGINHNDFPSVAKQYEKPIMEFVNNCLVANPHK